MEKNKTAETSESILPELEKIIGLDFQKKALEAVLEKKKPALLIGEAGTGKTTLAQLLAKSLGRSVVRINLNGYVTPDALIGRFMAKANNGTETYFQYGSLPKAMREGAVVILDELNMALAETLACLHAVLENEPRLFIPETGEEILPADGFQIIATMNPTQGYAGTRVLNTALYSRFSVVIRFPTLKGAELLKALKIHAPTATDKNILAVAKVFEKAQEARNAEKINTLITIREAISALEFHRFLGIRDAIESAIFSKLEPFERNAVTSAELPDSDCVSINETIELAKQSELFKKEIDRLNREIKKLEKFRELLKIAEEQNKTEPADGKDGEK